MVSAHVGSVFSKEEYSRRLAATQATMRARGLDAVLIHQPEHLYYLTGFPGPGAGYGINQVCVVPAQGDPTVVIRKMEEQPILATSWVKDYATWSDYESTTGVLKRVVEDRDLADKRIGVEYDSWGLTPARLHKIQDALPEARLEDFSRVLWYQRQRKSAEEIAQIRRAADIAVKAVGAGIETAAEGVSELQIRRAILDVYDAEGADPDGSDAIVTSGENLRFVHASPSARGVQKGDAIHMEVCPATVTSRQVV